MSIEYKAYLDYLKQLEAVASAVSANIEKYRKTDYTITLENRSDSSVSALLSITQRSHEFHFGCNGLMLGGFNSDSENEEYERLFLRLFNLVTTTLCCSVYSPQKGQYDFDRSSFRRPSPDRVAAFAKNNRLILKGQPLLADSWHPEWMKTMSADEVRKYYADWFCAVKDRYSDKFDIFDMVNEAFLCHERTPDFQLYDDELSFVDWAFKLGGSIFPKTNKLELNESTSVNYCKGDKYFELVKRLCDERCRPDMTGFQFHMPYCNPSDLPPQGIYDNYMKFCELGIPLCISEITIPSCFSGCDDAQGELLQAQLAEQLYRLWFAVPDMAGIIYWNMRDGQAWQNEGDWLGGVVNSAMQPKAAYNTLDSLINKQWRTEFKRTVTLKKHGRETLSFRGFRGEYDIACDNPAVCIVE